MVQIGMNKNLNIDGSIRYTSITVDNNDFTPVSFEQVKMIIEKQVKESKI